MAKHMKKTAWIVLLYGSLVFIGGVIGHLKAESKASLIAGVTSGSLLLLSSLLMFKKKLSGYISAFILALLLDGFFTWRFAKTLKFFPSGFLSLTSLAVIIIVACKISRTIKMAR